MEPVFGHAMEDILLGQHLRLWRVAALGLDSKNHRELSSMVSVIVADVNIISIILNEKNPNYSVCHEKKYIFSVYKYVSSGEGAT